MIIDKEFLREHAEHRKELRDELQRYELTHGVSYYGNSPSNIDGMPHCHSVGNATMDSVIRKSDTETYIDKLETLVNKEQRQIEEVLKKIVKANQKYVIRLKYYHCLDWDDIADQMYGDIRGYYNNLDKYKTKCMRVHGLALQNILLVQKEDQTHEYRQ